MSDIQDGLDATRAQLGESSLQTTTVDPGRSYGGRIVFDRLANGSNPQPVTLRVSWNGEVYTFGFQLAKAGTPTPAFAATSAVPIPRPISTPDRQIGAETPAITNVAYVTPPSFVDRNAFPRPTRSSIATGPAASPKINLVVQKTADYYINPLRFDDGAVATRFAASGSRLSMLVKVQGDKPLTDASKAALTRTICENRSMLPVVGQGGSISAALIGGNGQKQGTLVLDAQACSL